MEIELNKEELAQILADHRAINEIALKVKAQQSQLIQRAQKRINQHRKHIQELEQEICDREDLPVVPIKRWDFSGVDEIRYEGAVTIPDGNLDQENPTEVNNDERSNPRSLQSKESSS